MNTLKYTINGKQASALFSLTTVYRFCESMGNDFDLPEFIDWIRGFTESTSLRQLKQLSDILFIAIEVGSKRDGVPFPDICPDEIMDSLFDKKFSEAVFIDIIKSLPSSGGDDVVDESKKK